MNNITNDGTQQMPAQENYEEEIQYKMSSSSGIIFGIIATSTTHVITMKKDDMNIFTLPKKLNKLPYIRYEDISSVDVTSKVSWYYLIMGILLCFTIIMPLIFLLFGINKKITITLNNGMQTVLYAKSKSIANQFVNDLQKRIYRAKTQVNS